VLDACQAHGTVFNSGVLNRFSKTFGAARDLIDQGHIGEPKAGVQYPARSLLHGHIHSVDALSYLLGDPRITRVRGELHPRDLEIVDGRLDDDPMATYHLEFENGVEAWCIPAGQHEFEIVGTEGVVRTLNNAEGLSLRVNRPTDSTRHRGWHAEPLPEVESESWFLNDTPSGTLSSVLDGSLERNAGPETTAEYKVDYGTGLGSLGRMRFMLHDEYIRHPHLHDRALRCATFTGPRFTEEVEITGSPALFLELATTASDGAIHVTLEQVMPNGNAEYVTEGWLNLRHRKVSESPRPHAGPAWHSQAEQDLLEVVPGERMTAALELYPVSVSIGAGSRLRLTVAGTDRDNLYVPERDPAPVLTLFFGGRSGSRLELPVEDVARRPEGRVIPGAFEGQDPGFAFGK